MLDAPKTPASVAICDAMVKLASHLLPRAQKEDWRQEWLAEIWHSWQFLYHAGEWNWREATRLIRNSMGAFPDAVWHFTRQAAVRNRIRECLRSPWMVVAALAAALLILSAITSGLPATRGLFPFNQHPEDGRLVSIWFHSGNGGGERGFPGDVEPAWQKHSRLLASVAPFKYRRQVLETGGGRSVKPLVIETQASLFRVLKLNAQLGSVPESTGVVLSHQLWTSFFHADPRIVGSKLRLGGDWYTVAAVLPAGRQFLSRQPSVYLLNPYLYGANTAILARVRPGVPQARLDAELVKIAEHDCYYFFSKELRYAYLDESAWIPLSLFGVALLASLFLILAASRPRWRYMRAAVLPGQRIAAAKRAAFFALKAALALALVFIGGLEWSRSESAILLGSRDPAGGPFMLWLYILGAMGVLFWSVADQRARCRVCLRLMCFPVRVGCPGCLLLNWSGTELLCTEGHGVLHVPDLAPSWQEEPERWIAFDESWKDLFAETK